MIRNRICLVAQGVVRDAEGGGISVFNIMEGITAQGFPLFVGRMGFLATWEKEQDDPDVYHATFEIKINDQKLHGSTIDVDFKGKNRNRTIMAIQGVVVPAPGELSFLMTLDNGISAGCVIPVLVAPGAVQTQQESEA